MAYVPPHKRHSKKASPTTCPMNVPVPFHLQRNSKKHSCSNLQQEQQRKDKDSDPFVSKWFIVPSNDSDDGQIPGSIQLQLVESKFGKKILFIPTSKYSDQDDEDGENGQVSSSISPKPMILVCSYGPRKEFGEPNIEVNEIARNFAKCPWMSIVEEIQHDLLTSFQNVRSEMCYNGLEVIKPSFIVKFGTNLLSGGPFTSPDYVMSSDVKTALQQLNRMFHTSIPMSYVKTILGEVIPKIGVDFEAEKECYHVKVFDKFRQHANISCKCSVIKAVGELELHKIELNQMRRLIVDISDVDKCLDLRLMLSQKRIITALTDDEMDSLRKVIKSAVIDSEMKGGLRWPLGKESLSDRFSVIEICHAKSKTFKNSSMRLKLRHNDEYNFRSSSGGVYKEVSVGMTEIDKQLRDATVELAPITDMVHETLKLVWENFF